MDVAPEKTFVNWSEYANENNDHFHESESFKAVVYDDTYNFVQLKSSENKAKVCSDDQTFCCLAEFDADFTSDVFSLGVFSGNHYKDGSVSGSFYIEMCTIIKCDPADVDNTCTQDTISNYSFLTRSDTVFKTLKLAGTFSANTRVFPEALFDEVTLQPELVSISPDGILSLTENDENIPLVSMSLFGRRFELDADQPNNFCPSTEFF